MFSYSRSGAVTAGALPANGKASASKAGLLLAICGFLVFGAVASWYAVPLAERFGSAQASAVLLLAPAVALLGVSSVRKALSKWRSFRAELRWWHWLWFFVLASGFIFRVRDASDARQDPADAAALFRVALIGTVALVLTARLALKKPDWLSSLFSGLPGAMALFALAGVVSTAWSVNAPWTFYKSVEFFIDVALVAAILAAVRTGQEYESLFDWNWILCGLLLLSAWVSAAISPQEALFDGYSLGKLGFRLSGLYPGQGSNRLGDLGAIVGVVCFSRLFPLAKRRYDRFWYVLVLLFCLGTIIASQTRTALAGLALGMALVFVLTGRTVRLLLILGVAAGLAMMAGGAGSLMEYLQRGQSQAEMLSLSDRLTWWAAALDMFRAHPWTGLGAFAAGTFGVFEKLGLNNVGPLHSDYIETLAGTSFWGLVPLLAAILGTWWVLLRSLRDPFLDESDRQLCMEAIAVLMVVSIRSVFMTFITMHPPLNFTVLLGYAELLRRRRRSLRARIVRALPAVPERSAVSLGS